MASGPLDESALDSLQAERDALTERCAQAEQQINDLTARLEAANARISELESAAAPASIFDGGSPGDGLALDGSDPRVLSMALAATSVVAGMVAVLALLNDNLGTPFGIAMTATTLGLAYAAARTRVQATEVTVTNGVVYARKGETSYRFDVRQPGTSLDMVGQPGDPSWQVYFHRKGMDDFVVDARMVDPHRFVRELREHRPDL